MSLLTDLQSYATQVATQFGIPPSLFLWQINQESGFNPNAQNGAATGIAQFMPATAAQYGVNPSDPYSSLLGAAHYDSDLYNQYGSYQGMLAHYGTAYTADSPASVNTAATNAINAVDPQSTAGMNWFNGTLTGLENLFGSGASDIFSGDYFGGMVPELGGTSDALGNTRQPGASLFDPFATVEDLFARNGHDWLTRGVAIAIALVFIVGGIYLFGTGTKIAILKKA